MSEFIDEMFRQGQWYHRLFISVIGGCMLLIIYYACAALYGSIWLRREEDKSDKYRKGIK